MAFGNECILAFTTHCGTASRLWHSQLTRSFAEQLPSSRQSSAASGCTADVAYSHISALPCMLVSSVLGLAFTAGRRRYGGGTLALIGRRAASDWKPLDELDEKVLRSRLQAYEVDLQTTKNLLSETKVQLEDQKRVSAAGDERWEHTEKLVRAMKKSMEDTNTEVSARVGDLKLQLAQAVQNEAQALQKSEDSKNRAESYRVELELAKVSNSIDAQLAGRSMRSPGATDERLQELEEVLRKIGLAVSTALRDPELDPLLLIDAAREEVVIYEKKVLRLEEQKLETDRSLVLMTKELDILAIQKDRADKLARALRSIADSVGAGKLFGLINVRSEDDMITTTMKQIDELKRKSR